MQSACLPRATARWSVVSPKEPYLTTHGACAGRRCGGLGGGWEAGGRAGEVRRVSQERSAARIDRCFQHFLTYSPHLTKLKDHFDDKGGARRCLASEVCTPHHGHRTQQVLGSSRVPSSLFTREHTGITREVTRDTLAYSTVFRIWTTGCHTRKPSFGNGVITSQYRPRVIGRASMPPRFSEPQARLRADASALSRPLPPGRFMTTLRCFSNG